MHEFKSIKIWQFGVGGTGSYLIPPLTKYLNSLHNISHKTYMLIDDDIVETKNVYRQNFSFEDIGKKKCQVFFDRGKHYKNITHNYADVKINNNNYSIFTKELLNKNDDIELLILVGCVDNIPARLNISGLIEYYINTYSPNDQIIYYVDSGNLINSGQIYVFKYNNTVEDARNNSKTISDIFNDPKVQQFDNLPSCSDNGDQSIMANFQAASILYNVISEIIIIGDTTLKKISFLRYYRNIECDDIVQLKNGMY